MSYASQSPEQVKHDEGEGASPSESSASAPTSADAATPSPSASASADAAIPSPSAPSVVASAPSYTFREMMREVPPMLVVCLVLAVVGMNLLANKSVNTGVSWLALGCGLIYSWFCYLTMDVITRCIGPKAATQLSLVALGFNLFMAAMFFLGSLIPGEWSAADGTNDAVINTALDATFHGTWFVVLGSSVAFAVSSLTNNYLNDWIGRHLRRDHGFGAFITRSSVSSLIAQIVDNLVFALIVSRTFFGWSLTQCITCALASAAIELLCEVIFTPLGYRISRNILTARKVS